MNANELLNFAKISEITYENPDTSVKKFNMFGYSIVKFFDKAGAQAYLLTDGTNNVLSFRGTEVKEKSDVVADLKMHKVFEIDLPAGIAKGKVHQGFRDELDKLWPDIQKELSINRNIPLYITGHSLGAAMATIAASRISNKVEALVTFGSPRVGTKAFIENSKVVHFRVQNNNDDVPKVPPLVFGFRHHGTNVYLSYEGKIKEYNIWQRIIDMLRSRKKALSKGERFKGIKDHMMSNYIKKLSNLTQNGTP